MNIEVGDGRRETGEGRRETGEGRREKDFVNAAAGRVSPFRGIRGERGEEEVGKKVKGER